MSPCRHVAILATFALWLLVLPAVHSIAEGATHGDLVQARFQQILDRWGYQEWWAMWEQGTGWSRAAISQDAFARRMESGQWQLACCDKRLRALHIAPVSSTHVVVSAVLLFETKGSPRTTREQPYQATLHFYLEDDLWRVDLSGLGHP